MHELVTLEAFSRFMTVIALGGFGLGVLVAVVLLALRRGWRAALLSLVCGLLAPLAWAGWRYFLWATYPHPRSLYVGLHHPSTLAGVLLLFLGAGAVVGLILRRLRALPPGDTG